MTRVLRTVAALLLCGVLLLCTACGGERQAATLAQFTELMQQNGYEVVDLSGDLEGAAQQAAVAIQGEVMVEFYVLENVSHAQEVFVFNRQTVEEFKTDNHTEKSGSNASYDRYELHSGGMCIVLSRVGNTFLYTCVAEDDQKDVVALIKQLGY